MDRNFLRAVYAMATQKLLGRRQRSAFAKATADLATVTTDKTTVHNDYESVEAARKAALTTTSVMAAQAALTAPIATAQPLIQADRAAIKSDETAAHNASEAAEAVRVTEVPSQEATWRAMARVRGISAWRIWVTSAGTESGGTGAGV